MTMNAARTRGFTLIELVVVITILGILAAFAVPKFIALDGQARAATVQGLAGSVRSAAALARGLAMATGATASVTMEGTTVNLVNNYPDSGLTGIAGSVNSNNGASGDFTFTAGPTAATGPATWTKNGAPTPANCVVNYTPPAAAGAAPVVTTDVTGC
jgi:MSHA pilin protein MshA